MKSARLCWTAASLTMLALGCGAGTGALAHGTATSIIVVAADSLWQEVGDSVLASLEPRIFTVRQERTFEVTQVSPTSKDWLELRRFVQVLVIGTAEDSWVTPALDEAIPPDSSAIELKENVWARNQLVTALVVPRDRAAQAVLEQLPRLADGFDQRFRAYARQRMFLSGVDSVLRDSLAQSAGFSLLLPGIYQHEVTDSTHAFHNFSQVRGDIFRNVLVERRSGLDSLSITQILDWRDGVAHRFYQPVQATERDPVQVERLPGGGEEVHGVWRSEDGDWPAGGPFILRVVPCPAQGRTYLLDTWLYAPARPKYEYMIQLQTILDSFHCTASRGAAAGAATSAGAAD